MATVGKMDYGLFWIGTGAASHPEGQVRIAQAAETAGFESLWTGEHIVLPNPKTPDALMGPYERILDPLISFAFLAGQTRTIRFGSGITILPQRNPLVLAKEVATLQVLSGNRLMLGIGVGYLQPEFAALEPVMDLVGLGHGSRTTPQTLPV